MSFIVVCLTATALILAQTPPGKSERVFRSTSELILLETSTGVKHRWEGFTGVILESKNNRLRIQDESGQAGWIFKELCVRESTAIDHFTHRLKASSANKSELFALRACVHLTRNALDKALSDINESILLDRNSSNLIIKSNILRKQLNCVEAKAILTEVLTKGDQNEHAHLFMGLLYEQMGEHINSVAAFDAALAVRPGFLPALRNRAVVLRSIERYSEALSDLGECLKTIKDDPQLHLERGELYEEQGSSQKALKCYDEALGINPRYIEALLNKGNLLKRLSDYIGARPCFDSAIAAAPKSSYAYFYRGQLFLSQKDYKNAINDLLMANRLDDNDAAIQSCLAWVLATCPYDQLRDGKRAVFLAESALRKESVEHSYHMALAAAYAENSEWKNAINAQKKAIDASSRAHATDMKIILNKYYLNRTPYRLPK